MTQSSSGVPAVSVIVPAYRVTEYIGETIRSVLAQTFRSFELIVVNDGCPDTEALEAVLQPFQGQIVYVKKSNGGLASARNAGLRVARGSLIALLDGDDAWEPDYLAVQVAFLAANPSVDIVYPNGRIFGDSPLAGHLLMDLSPSEGPVTFESLVGLRCAVMVSVTARKAAIERAGGFDESLRRVEDFDLWLRVVKSGGNIAYHRQPLLRYRRRDTSLSANSVAMRRAGLDVLEKAERVLDLTASERSALLRAKDEFRAQMAYYAIKEAVLSGNDSAAHAAVVDLNSIRWSLRYALLQFALRAAPRTAMRLMAARNR